MRPSAAAPAGYRTGRERGAAIVALPSAFRTVCDVVATGATLYSTAAGTPGAVGLTGRGSAWLMDGDDGRWVVRHYRRGGAVARLLDDRYLRVGASRPERELEASVLARARGVATPEVVATVVYPAGAFYRADIATRHIPDSTDLAAAALGPHRLGSGERVAAWNAAATLLRHTFDAGVVHPDLNLRNILIEATGAGLAAWLIDLDRARVLNGPVPDSARARMMARLHRSRRKLEHEYATTTSPEELRPLPQ